ncbi:MAG: hypothetical protein K0Q64_2282, partial [Nitrobacter vulgaris]|nr:hypothetical protein [Nitrobacter vulgaris]
KLANTTTLNAFSVTPRSIVPGGFDVTS